MKTMEGHKNTIRCVTMKYPHALSGNSGTRDWSSTNNPWKKSTKPLDGWNFSIVQISLLVKFSRNIFTNQDKKQIRILGSEKENWVLLINYNLYPIEDIDWF